MILRLAAGLLLAYAVWCALLFLMQDRMLFPAALAGTPGEPFHPRTEVLERRIDEATTVRAWLIPAAGDGDPAPLLVFFHGNAELIDHQAELARWYLARGFTVLLPEYRGYGHSEGRPSQAGIVDDAVHFLDLASARAEVDGARVVLHGRSIGGAVAAQVAARRPATAVVLVSTPVSVAGMAWRVGAPPFLVRNPFRTDTVLPQLDAPVLLLHGSRDREIPVRHSRRLHELARQSRLVEYDAGHNDFPPPDRWADYWREIEEHIGL